MSVDQISGHIIVIERTVNIKDEIKHQRVNKSPLISKQGEIVGILYVVTDITKYKLLLEEKNNILENIIAMMPGHVYWMDTNEVYLGCNDNQATSAGLKSRFDIIGQRSGLLPWNNSNKDIPELNINRQVMQSGNSVMVEESRSLLNGEPATFLSNKAPLYGNNNKIIGMVGISFDYGGLIFLDRKMAL